ncbi:hypothetical protein [Pseudonocardia aurantiaca]|uniref:hypothetical protein n=1 Tax=Pseudonocardia aurantiaca TaxID=75290 RepID=UPI0031DC691C
MPHSPVHAADAAVSRPDPSRDPGAVPGCVAGPVESLRHEPPEPEVHAAAAPSGVARLC